MAAKKTTLDIMNRIVLPDEVMMFGWGPGTVLEIVMLDNGVAVRAAGPMCKLCGASTVLLEAVGNTVVCGRCVRQLLEAHGGKI
jgi:ribosomal protein S27AE